MHCIHAEHGVHPLPAIGGNIDQIGRNVTEVRPGGPVVATIMPVGMLSTILEAQFAPFFPKICIVYGE
jgi:hypothetical protein